MKGSLCEELGCVEKRIVQTMESDPIDQRLEPTGERDWLGVSDEDQSH